MTHTDPKRARKAVSWLSVLTPLAAVVSVINVAIAISTSVWLKTSEQIFVDASNATNPRTEVPRTKRTVSGLWKLCEYHNLTLVNGTTTHCFHIDYFAKERYTPEPHDSTMAVPYTVTKAGPLFFIASFLLAIGILSAILGYLWRRKRVATFVAGILFIIAGLVMLIGMVVYLSVLQAEVGQKLKPRNSLDKPVFEYTYGYSFIMIVIGFMSTEMTGTCAIFWYIYWHQLDWAEKAGTIREHYSGDSNLHLHHHHRHHHYQPQGGHDSHNAGQHSHHRHYHGPRRQHSRESKAREDDFPRGYGSSTPGGGMGGSGGYCDRSASSAEDNQLDCGGPLPLHYHHRHRSASHSGGTHSVFSTGVESRDMGGGSVGPSYYTYNKLYPCKKHGTIPPRMTNNHRHHHGHYNTHRVHRHAHTAVDANGEPLGNNLGDDISFCPMYYGGGGGGKCNKYSNSGHFTGIFDDDLMGDLDVPLPPPPPLPRDITCTTTVSGDDLFLDHAVSTVGGGASNAQNYSRERCTPRDHRKTTPV